MTTAVAEKAYQHSVFRVKLDRYPDDHLEQEVVRTHKRMNSSKAKFLVALGEFMHRGLAEKSGASSTVMWLVRRLNVARATGYEYVNVASRLVGFGQLTDAFCEGTISYSTVRLLLKYMRWDNEEELLELALSLGYSELVTALSGYDRTTDGTNGDDSDSGLEEFRLSTDKHGFIVIKGRLSPVNGAKLIAALKQAELIQSTDSDDPTSPEATPAETKVPSFRTTPDEKNTPKKDRPVSHYDPPTAQGMLSALLGMIEVVRTSPGATTTAAGAQVNIIYSPDGSSFLAGNPSYRGRDMATQLLNGDIRGIVLNNKGAITHYGRRRRLVSPTQANMVLTRWLYQCGMPGCNHTRFLQFHHITAWTDGGFTDETNLIPLCSSCHSYVSRGLITITTKNDDAHLYFIFPNGETYFSENRSTPKHNPTEQSNVR